MRRFFRVQTRFRPPLDRRQSTINLQSSFRRSLIGVTTVLALFSVALGDAAPASAEVPPAGVPAEDAEIRSFPTGVTAQAVTPADSDAVVSEPVEAPLDFTMIGFDIPAGETIRFRVSPDGRAWAEWQTADEIDEGPDGGSPTDEDGRVATGAAWVGSARWVQVEARDPGRVTAHLIDSSGDPAADAAAVAVGENQITAAAAQPTIISRAGWGADESITKRASIASGARHAVVHHTASTNTYNPEDVPGMIRGFHRYHTVTQGWSDIGYNFLIDKFGRIYEGRNGGITKAVIGAHAMGFNTGSIGVSLIGNFDQATPTTAAMNALRQLLAWKFDLHGIDPTATVSLVSGGSPKYASGVSVKLPAINGHRDSGLTSCPGKNLYSLLPGLGAAVKGLMGKSSGGGGTPGGGTDLARSCLPEGDPGIGPVWRAAGANRVATAITASRWYWRSSETAVVASAGDFPDALAAGALASQQDAPLLLTSGARLDADVAYRLKEMGAKRVWVMGGTAVLSSRIDSDLRALGLTVTRVAGANRFATAADAARRAGAPGREATLALGSHVDPGRAWPDAVAAGALSATPQRLPTLLTRTDRLPAETAQTLKDLGIRTVWILGGEAAVTKRVEQAVAQLGITVRRLAGDTRYGTSIAAVTEARRRHGSSQTQLVIASGANYPDALAGAAVAARRDSPMLLVPPCGLEQAPEIAEYLRRSISSYRDGVILGSTSAISERIRWQVGREFVR